MNGIIIDERAVKALIHHFRHMDSNRRLVECHRERLSSVVKYLELCLESQPAESSNVETLAQHTTGNKSKPSDICPFEGCDNPKAKGKAVCEQHLDIVF